MSLVQLEVCWRLGVGEASSVGTWKSTVVDLVERLDTRSDSREVVLLASICVRVFL